MARRPRRGEATNHDRPTAEGPSAEEPRVKNPRDRHQEALLDQAIEETFPASDPISPMVIT